MAKFKHDVCGREFRTARGRDTHVVCEPVAKPRRKAAKSPREGVTHTQRVEARAQELIADGFEGGYVRAKILAGRELGPAGAPERKPRRLRESGSSPAKPNRTRGRKARPTSGRTHNELTLAPTPEGEGTRLVELSETVARQLAEMGLVYAQA